MERTAHIEELIAKNEDPDQVLTNDERHELQAFWISQPKVHEQTG